MIPRSTQFLILDYVSELCLSMCSSSMRFVLVIFFFIFQDSVLLVSHLDALIFVHFFNSTGAAIVEVA